MTRTLCIMQASYTAKWVLSIGLAYVFALFGIDKFLHPIFWIGWIPSFFEGFLFLSRGVWLQIFGGIELMLAVFLLSPKRKVRQVVSILVSLHLIAVLTQTGLFTDIGVRDTGLLFMAVALFLLI